MRRNNWNRFYCWMPPLAALSLLTGGCNAPAPSASGQSKPHALTPASAHPAPRAAQPRQTRLMPWQQPKSPQPIRQEPPSLLPADCTIPSLTLNQTRLLRDPRARTYAPELGVVLRGDPKRREIALTFDDGPHPAHLPRLLRVLKEHQVKATFFLVGKRVEATPELAAWITEEGHEIANHTFHHRNMSQLTPKEQEAEIEATNRAVERATGTRPRFFRPPGGQFKDEVLRTAVRLRMQTAFWSVTSVDHDDPRADHILANILKGVEPGAIVLLHNGIEPTVDILPTLIQYLRDAGYRFVTLSEMFPSKEPTPVEPQPAEESEPAQPNADVAVR